MTNGNITVFKWTVRSTSYTNTNEAFEVTYSSIMIANAYGPSWFDVGVSFSTCHYSHFVKIFSVVNLPIIIYQMNFSDKYRKQIKRKFNFETYFCRISAPTFDNEILFRQKKNRTPDLALSLSNLNCLYGRVFCNLFNDLN